MNILLTGGSGFIGKNILASYLPKKYNFIAPNRTELDISDQISTTHFFNTHDIDIVIHSACKPGHRNAKDPQNILNTNLRMFYNLLEQKNKYKKFINLGSGAIYDMRHYLPKMDETYAGTHIPIDDHGLCKYIIEKQISYLPQFIDLRIFGIFGKYEDYTIRFISNAICKAISNLPITLKQNRRFDYLFIDDLMPILDHFINNEAQNKAYNITPNRSIELLEIAKLIRVISGKNNLPIHVDSEGMGLEYSGNNALLKKQYPLIKFTPIEQSVSKLYKWYDENQNNINPSSLLLDK
jgi:UDP-glucose 4-epimerase